MSAGSLRVAITGASGLVGSRLVTALERRGHRPLRLVRRPPETDDEAEWSPDAGLVPSPRVERLDALVHLAGENIAGGRWTEERKRAIRDSRVGGTARLVESLARLDAPPGVLVSASATGYYGDRGDQPLDETAPPGDGFLAEVCQAWEAAAVGGERWCDRVVTPRFGLVLSGEGGALQRMLLPFKLGLGGPLGSGEQHFPWIALDDLARVILAAIEDPSLSGPVNAVAPDAITNRRFTRALGRVLHRPTVMRVPAPALRLALGREMADELLLTSARVVPARLLAAGFAFEHPEIEGALRAALTDG